MSKTLFIKSAWEGYAKLLPPNASQTQITETRLAFFSGASVLFSLLTGPLLNDSGDEPSIHDEIAAFGVELDARAINHKKKH